MNEGLGEESLIVWLGNIEKNQSKDKRYRHTLLKEKNEHKLETMEPLKIIFKKAHEDARQRLRKAFEISLDPFDVEGEEEVQYDPAEGYPEVLGMTTLKGYFGEVFAGIIAENFSPFEEDNWKVPAFSFRYHEIAFDQLEMLMQTGENIENIPGRTGDDCLAFVLDNGKIIKVLFCEAKCTAGHSETMIKKAHEQISTSNRYPVELRRLIEILNEYDSKEAKLWVKALRELWFSRAKPTHERYNLVSYVCGQSPKVPKDRRSWIPSDVAHNKYTGIHKLEAVEVHLDDIEGTICELYGKEV
ncbi:hypothetical protein [Priestia megaterium]